MGRYEQGRRTSYTAGTLCAIKIENLQRMRRIRAARKKNHLNKLFQAPSALLTKE
jgi:hypothetical protein